MKAKQKASIIAVARKMSGQSIVSDAAELANMVATVKSCVISVEAVDKETSNGLIVPQAVLKVKRTFDKGESSEETINLDLDSSRAISAIADRFGDKGLTELSAKINTQVKAALRDKTEVKGEVRDVTSLLREVERLEGLRDSAKLKVLEFRPASKDAPDSAKADSLAALGKMKATLAGLEVLLTEARARLKAKLDAVSAE